MPVLQLDKLRIDRPGGQHAEKPLCEELSFTLEKSRSCALLGKNGCGKTSLLHSLTGLGKHAAGQIKLHDRTIDKYSRGELAKTVGLLFQNHLDDMPSTVLELVLLGRHPHNRSRLWDDKEDLDIANAALSELGLLDMAQREITTLSGGERQRLAIACVLTQNPDLYLLDEPSNHLDIAFQITVLNVLSQRIKKADASMIMATHDINLAARFCEDIILMLGDGNVIAGSREQVLNLENLSIAFDCEIRAIEDGKGVVYFPA